MNEHEKGFYLGLIMIVVGVGTILFGGTTETESYVELFGFRFGSGESRRMGRAESWFSGAVIILIGVFVVRSS